MILCSLLGLGVCTMYLPVLQYTVQEWAKSKTGLFIYTGLTQVNGWKCLRHPDIFLSGQIIIFKNDVFKSFFFQYFPYLRVCGGCGHPPHTPSRAYPFLSIIGYSALGPASREIPASNRVLYIFAVRNPTVACEARLSRLWPKLRPEASHGFIKIFYL